MKKKKTTKEKKEPAAVYQVKKKEKVLLMPRRFKFCFLELSVFFSNIFDARVIGICRYETHGYGGPSI